MEDQLVIEGDAMKRVLYGVDGGQHSHLMLTACLRHQRLLIAVDPYTPDRSTRQRLAPDLLKKIATAL
ncbi:MAG: hypothetical protein AAGG11_10000 [Pseudomonadota bacterium]